MTKQEEIMETIDTFTDDICLYPDKDCEWRRRVYCVSGEDAYKCLMKRLDELGVVIKVERELPICAYWTLADIATDPKVVAMLKADYVAVEPIATD